ncbi:MAG: HAMP domain-containing sensor histidine kinase [Pseudohongiella sp.]|nr:HAMP domain-containing sensor histidine kinase [Pseudohongiella sp.]
MLLFRAQSIRQLTIIGFMVVATLLVTALLATVRQLDRQSHQSQEAVTAAATAMSTSRQIIEQTLGMERSALQFLILRDESLLQVYNNRKTEFHAAVAQLLALDNMTGDVTEIATNLLDAEASASALLANTQERRLAEAAYAGLSDTAYDLSDNIAQWITTRQSLLRERTDATQQALTIQALLFIAAASGLAALFVTLITRPLQQIDSAINRLGSGSYKDSIEITGPRDLQSLGVRLDWLRSRLNELEQQRASFLRHISHELKTPLASMQEGAALLGEGVVGPLNDEQREVSRIIITNGQRLQMLIEDVLRHNSQNFAVLNAMPEPVRFDQIVEAVVAAHQWPVTSNRIKVHREMEKLVVLADPERLRVVVDNIFTNALKFSPADGVITLRLFTRDDGVVFDVADEGPGVPLAERTKVFTAFYQGSAKPRGAIDGTGLGLAIAREYVLAAGGRIEVCEVAKGACFRVTLPLPQKRIDDNTNGETR